MHIMNTKEIYITIHELFYLNSFEEELFQSYDFDVSFGDICLKRVKAEINLKYSIKFFQIVANIL